MNLRSIVLAVSLGHAFAGAAFAQSDDMPPTTPGNPTVEVYSPTFAVVQWQRSTDDRGAVAGYEVLRDEVSLGTFDALSYVDRDLRPGRGYDYVILAIDNAGQRSLRATVRAVTPDAIPSPPSGVRAEVYSRTAAELFWDRSPVFGQRYEVKRDGEVVASTDGTGYVDDTLTAARPYLFEVIALNRQGKRSAPVRLFVDTSGEGTGPGPVAGPAAPAGLRASVYSGTAAEVFWDRPTTSGLVHEVRRDGELLATTDGTSWFDDTLAGGTGYTYEIIAIDREGRRSTPSSVMLSTPADSAPPVPEASVISVDNHVELLKHVFDIYTGNAYGPAVLALPGYSATPEGPSGPGPELGEPFVVTETCSNGGTAVFDRIRWGSFGETVGWVYDFDDCQDGTDVLDGVLSDADNGDTLVLEAANGDHETVRIEISADGVTETLTQPWSLWRDHLEFSTEFLGGL